MELRRTLQREFVGIEVVWPKQVPRGALPRFQFKNHHRNAKLTFPHVDAWRRLTRSEPSPNEVRLLMELDALYHRVMNGEEVDTIESDVEQQQPTPQMMSAEAIKAVMRAAMKKEKKRPRGMQPLIPVQRKETEPP